MPRPTHSFGRLPVMTSGLVVTLATGESLAALEAAPPLTLGRRSGDRLPVALEADDAAASERWTEWVRDLPGVAGVEVVFVHWDDAGKVIHDGE